MIRVLHSVSNMDRAGIETMLMNYYRNMDRSQIQFDFLCNKTKPGDYDAEILAMGGHIYHSPGLNPLKRPQYMRFMKQLLAENPDIRILHAHNEAMAEYALEGAKRAGLAHRIFHSHNTRIEKDFKWPLKMVCKHLLRFQYTDMWACGRDAGAYYFGRKNVDAGNVHLLHNAIDLDTFAFDSRARDRLRGQYGLEDAFVLGHVGRFNVQKNHAFLLEAFADVLAVCPKARLVLIGTGELIDVCKEKAKQLGIARQTLFLGSIGNVYEWYSAMDLFVMPSLFEGLPVVSIEAQANGLKCVFSESVSREADVSGRCEYLPLDRTKWTERLPKLTNAGHDANSTRAVRQSGYDIKLEAKQLSEDYKRMLLKGKP